MSSGSSALLPSPASLGPPIPLRRPRIVLPVRRSRRRLRSSSSSGSRSSPWSSCLSELPHRENGAVSPSSPSSSSSGQVGDISPSIQQQTVIKSMAMPDNASGTSRPGLFRTPISGGVQSATLAHRLPDPAVAVRNLMEQARFAHLSTVMSRMHHRRKGYPFGSFVDFAPDAFGHPIFSLSPLAIHTRNLLADPRCSLLVQNPGWSGLANARATLFGDVYRLSPDQQEYAHNHFMAKHQQAASQQWRNFDYFRMDVISDIYFIGGFGTVAWVDTESYVSSSPDIIAKYGSEKTLKELNNTFSERLRNAFSADAEVDDAAFISIDSQGVDVRVRQGAQYNVQRLSFSDGFKVENLKQAVEALDAQLTKEGYVYRNM